MRWAGGRPCGWLTKSVRVDAECSLICHLCLAIFGAHGREHLGRCIAACADQRHLARENGLAVARLLSLGSEGAPLGALAS